MKSPLVLGLAALAALSAAFAPVHAETVYVPLALHEQAGATLYRTEVSVTNPSAAPLRFTTLFIPTQNDGTRQTGVSAPVTVPSRGTFLLSPVVPAGNKAGKAGVLEIAGATPLVATARLQAVRNGRVIAETALPVVSTENLFPAGETAHIQGIGRAVDAAGTATRLGLLNLSGAEAHCAVAAFRPDGSRLGEAPALTVAPLSHLSYEGSLTALRKAPVADARLEVTCDAPFYTYAASLSATGATFHAPSAPLSFGLESADPSLTQNPGEELADDSSLDAADIDDAAEAVSAGPGNLALPGVFLAVSQGNPYRSFDLPLEPNVRYKMVTVEFDLYLHRWQSTWFHGITSMRRTDKTLYYGLLVKGSPTKTILDLGQHQQVKNNWGWRPGGNYHVRMDYDVAGRRVSLRVRQGGRIVHTVTGRMTNTDVRAFDRHKVQVDFSLPKAYHHAYYPPIGSRFSNLKVTAVPF
jgi:hypothetical protein